MGQPTREGRIPFHGFETWYKVVGEAEDSGRLPLVCLHGGPGALHHHMEPYEALAGGGRRVILYDQLGCGKSGIVGKPHDPSMYTPDLFVEEIGAIRDALGLERLHIIGHSWGGMLGMQYAITQPSGLASLVVESSPASMPQWVAEANRLRAELPPEVQETLLKHEDAGTTDDPEYEKAMMVFYDRHVCRVPWPDWLKRSFDGLAANPEVYHTMNGPSEFHVIGSLRDWDITGRLGEIRVPTLVMSGKYDEATPAIAETVHSGIPGSEWVLFENSSHMAQAEEPERALQVVGDFIARVEEDL
jgi:L-proline amide hydrolase